MTSRKMSKNDVETLIKTVNFLNNLKMGDLDFKSFNKGEVFLTFTDKNGKEVKIDYGKIEVDSSKDSNNSMNMANSMDSDVTNASTLAGLSDLENGQRGGNVYSDTSSEVAKTFIKSSKSLKKKSKEFSTTSSVMIGGYDKDSVTSSEMPKMMGGAAVNSDMYSPTSTLKEIKSRGTTPATIPTPSTNTPATAPTSAPTPALAQAQAQAQVQVQNKQKLVQPAQTAGGFSDTSSYNPRFLKKAIFSDSFVGGGADGSETSSVDPRMFGNNGTMSDTSSLNPKMMMGGGFSDTSSFNPRMMNGGGCSDTSSINPNMLMGGGLSDTSSFNPRMMNGGGLSDTSSFNPRMMMGGGDSDTIGSISELKEKKNQRKDLDLGIFKKQNGGSMDESKKNKLRGMGIHSSSTSSLCE